MATGKRFYWLKLKEDFFTSKRIKKLRKLAGGDTFTIIYLKLQLLAMKSDGVLRWTGLEQDFAAELALDIDEDVENIKVTMAYLLSCGLAESSDNVNFLFPYAVENVGSEGSSAQRMREARASLKSADKAKIEENAQSETQEEQSCTMCALSDGEKEIDKDREKELDEIKEDSAVTGDSEKRSRKETVFSKFAAGEKDLLDALNDFVKMRDKIGRPMSDRAKTMLLNKLQTFPKEQWIPILEQSIFHSWQGIFPLKDDSSQTRNRFGSGKSDKAQELDEFYGKMQAWGDGG